MTLGSGAVISASRKQMLTVATDDAVGSMLWASRFLLEQGYDVKTILYQDNRSAILAQLLESIPDIWKSDFSLSK